MIELLEVDFDSELIKKFARVLVHKSKKIKWKLRAADEIKNDFFTKNLSKKEEIKNAEIFL